MAYYDLNSIYKHPKQNGYGKDAAYKRFSFLKGLSFGSVLDVGSGPCFLKTWLTENDITAEYEAVDIRPDTLALCDCPVYEQIPKGRTYDLVCLFGTVTYNIGHDEDSNKGMLLHLLQQSKAACRSLLLFTVFKESTRQKYANSVPQDFFVYFCPEEIDSMMKSIGLSKYAIMDNPQIDDQEYFVLASVEA